MFAVWVRYADGESAVCTWTEHPDQEWCGECDYEISHKMPERAFGTLPTGPSTRPNWRPPERSGKPIWPTTPHSPKQPITAPQHHRESSRPMPNSDEPAIHNILSTLKDKLVLGHWSEFRLGEANPDSRWRLDLVNRNLQTNRCTRRKI